MAQAIIMWSCLLLLLLLLLSVGERTGSWKYYRRHNHPKKKRCRSMPDATRREGGTSLCRGSFEEASLSRQILSKYYNIPLPMLPFAWCCGRWRWPWCWCWCCRWCFLCSCFLPWFVSSARCRRLLNQRCIPPSVIHYQTVKDKKEGSCLTFHRLLVYDILSSFLVQHQ